MPTPLRGVTREESAYIYVDRMNEYFEIERDLQFQIPNVRRIAKRSLTDG